eukprot:GHVN01091990.1.p1 GENE.GHVN01091990.1~~GHVN01091990.1.p1  ORF type:complete len:197 (-),score=55.10 GHVN01091990.1:302-892(-)
MSRNVSRVFSPPVLEQESSMRRKGRRGSRVSEVSKASEVSGVSGVSWVSGVGGAEQMESRAAFNSIVHEINTIAYPHLDKGKQIAFRYAHNQALGFSDEKSKVPLPVLRRAREAERRKVAERQSLEAELGVQLQVGHTTYMPQVQSQLRKREKERRDKKKMFIGVGGVSKVWGKDKGDGVVKVNRKFINKVNKKNK